MAASAPAPLRLLQIDPPAVGGGAAPLTPPNCSVTRVGAIAEARRALARERYDLIVLDAGAAGEAASIVLLDTLPDKNVSTPVLLYCDYVPSEECRDRANLMLLKPVPASTLWPMIRTLAAHACGAAPWGAA